MLSKLTKLANQVTYIFKSRSSRMTYLTAKQVLSLMNGSDWENSKEELIDEEDFTPLVNPLGNAQVNFHKV